MKNNSRQLIINIKQSIFTYGFKSYLIKVLRLNFNYINYSIMMNNFIFVKDKIKE